VVYRSQSDVAAAAGRCGDGKTVNRLYDPSVTEDTEQCDDGNADGGDGCSSDCRFEPVPQFFRSSDTLSANFLPPPFFFYF
jgi:cysteine-rich repeat protein